MLNIFFGKRGKTRIYLPDDGFKFKGYKYLGTDFSKNLILDIDGCKYIYDKVVDSDVMGVIPALWLSTGSKMIMMEKYSDYPITATWIGDNTIKYLRKISKEKDILVIAGYLFGLFEEDDGDLDVRILNSGRVTHTCREFLEEAFDVIEEKGALENAVFEGQDWRI